MPNTVVFRQPFRKRGQAWLPPSRAITLIGDVTGSGGVTLGGAADVQFTNVVGSITGSGGMVLGGTATVVHIHRIGSAVGSGGVEVAGSGNTMFKHSGQVAADVVVEWDFDNDGDFSETVEDITPYALSLETFTGRDWPSLLTGKAGPGKFRATLRNDDDRFSYFNTSSPLNTSPRSLKTGRKVRVRIAGAANADPTLVVRDRFRRADGALEADETGKLYSEPLTVNKVQNPSFETNATGWTAQGGSTITRVTSIAQSGLACLEIKRASANPPFNLYGPKCTGVDSGATTGDTVVISAWVYIPAASYPKLTLIVFGAAGVDYASADTEGLAPDTWTQISRVVTLTGTLDDIDIQFWTDDTHANGDVVAYVDNVTATVTNWAVTSNRAVATDEGGTHLAVVDAGTADYYVQARIVTVGTTANRVGVVYRYVDADDYSLALVSVPERALYLIDVVGGVETVIAGQTFDVYSGVTVGVLVEGATATVYREGVAIASGTAINPSAELVGLYAEWATGDDRPEVADFAVWDGLPTEVTGILWTGDVAELVGGVEAGPRKLATVSGEGRLSRLATQRVVPPISINGQKTGLLVGNVLASAGLLHPPGSIDTGDITTGTVVMSETSAIDAARSFEETEYGFLYEMQEGPLAFEARSARDSRTSQATFTDAPDGKYGYHRLEPYDWRREVFNRVVAGITPWEPGEATTLFTDAGPYSLSPGGTQTIQAVYNSGTATWAGHTRKVATPAAPSTPEIITQSGVTTGSISISMPATVNTGDLLLIISNLQGVDDALSAVGWTFLYNFAYAKVAAGDEGGTTIAVNAINDEYAIQVWRITSWYGSLSGGVEMSSSSFAFGDNPNPPNYSPTWGSEPTLYVAAYEAFSPSSNPSQISVPAGYTSGAYTEAGSGAYRGVGSAYRQRTGVTSEDPGAFSTSGWQNTLAYTMAIRGGVGSPTVITESVPSGADGTFAIGYVASVGGTAQTHYDIEVIGRPLVQGEPVLVQADDHDSQDDHNAIRTYTNPANLFRSIADAQAYVDLVLSKHADDRPILSLSFYATKSKAYRKQAYTRRVGDKITLTATNNAGMGISRDFFIESISHKFSHGNRLWEVTWELSPA
ncbi:hypothetical protein GCM10009850_047660 [Nonomuraea monospora]|uniref:CBM-cenC domain-containing protein n=1 Tax=Nonomuraea monospora TaxID=568818 RepID=A0ABN3CJV0_9ACTN